MDGDGWMDGWIDITYKDGLFILFGTENLNEATFQLIPLQLVRYKLSHVVSGSPWKIPNTVQVCTYLAWASGIVLLWWMSSMLNSQRKFWTMKYRRSISWRRSNNSDTSHVSPTHTYWMDAVTCRNEIGPVGYTTIVDIMLMA